MSFFLSNITINTFLPVRAIDRNLLPISSQSMSMSVIVRKQSSLQHKIV